MSEFEVYADAARGGMLKGAAAIASHLFGDRTRRREVYYLVEQAKLPVFRLGSVICARSSTLDQWIASQERASLEAA